MVTVDTMVHGKRDHDIRNNFRMPLRVTPKLLLDLALHPRWCARMLRQGGSPQLVNLAKSAGAQVNINVQAAAMSRQMEMALEWDSIAWLRDHWRGNLLVKGVLSVEDTVLAHKQVLTA